MLQTGFVRGLALAMSVLVLSFKGDALTFGGPVNLLKNVASQAKAFLPQQQQLTSFAQPQKQAQVIPTPSDKHRQGGIALQQWPGVSLGGQLQAAVMPTNSMPIQMNMPMPSILGMPMQSILGMPMQMGQMRPPPPPNGRGGFNRGPGHWSDRPMMGGPPMQSMCVDQNQNNANWQQALLNEMMNYDDWICSTRTAKDGTVENCVLTGSYSASSTTPPAVITTGCGWVMPVFCDNSVNDIVNSLLSANPAAGVLPPTPTGYTLVPGSGFYKVHTEKLTWAAAQDACKAEGGHLAVPSNTTEYTELMKLLAAAGVTVDGAFVGFSDIAKEGSFVSVTGQPACQLGKILYNPGEPNNGGGVENCLQLGFQNIGTMNDIDCTRPLAFICQITLPSRLTPCRQ